MEIEAREEPTKKPGASSAIYFATSACDATLSTWDGLVAYLIGPQ